MPAKGNGVAKRSRSCSGPTSGRKVALEPGGLPRGWPSATGSAWRTLRKRLGRKPMIEVPDMDDDIHDLEG